MFRRVHQVNSALRFVRERLPHYGPLLATDLHLFREEIVKTTVGASVSAVAGLIFAAFFSLAVIVTAWDTHYRIATAWLVCLAWAGLALVGLGYARKALSGPLPFRQVSGAVARDYASLLSVIDHEAQAHTSR
jgi:hypothetical protein